MVGNGSPVRQPPGDTMSEPQGKMNKATLLYVPVNRIFPRPGGNVGGDERTRDTTNIQPSIREHGILKPLEVSPREDDTFYLEDGYRRWTAARQIDETMLAPVLLRDVPDDVLVQLRAIYMQSQPHAPVVIDGEGNVTGGWCRVVHELSQAGHHNYEIADLCGMTTDAAGAYVRLYDESKPVKEAVASERMAITVYSLIKTAPQEFKEHIVSKRGQITASYVRDARNHWSPQPKDDGAQSTPEREDTPDVQSELSMAEEVTSPDAQPTARLLNGALHRLRQVVGRELGEREWHIVEQIESTLKEME